MKYIKKYNERLGDKLSAPDNDEILFKLDKLTTEDILNQSLNNNYLIGLKYLIDNRKNDLSDDMIYIIEKYYFNLHQDEEKDYEIFINNSIKDLIYFYSVDMENCIIFKNKFNNNVLFNYYIKSKKLDVSNELSNDLKYGFKLDNRLIIVLIEKLMIKYFNIDINKVYCYGRSMAIVLYKK